MQQVIEDQGRDADNKKGNNSLVVHQGSDANKMINTPAVIRSSNGTIPRENTTAAVLSAEANPTTAAGTQSMGVTEVGKEHAKPGMTKSPTDSEVKLTDASAARKNKLPADIPATRALEIIYKAVSKATVVALAVTAALVAKPSAADQAESTLHQVHQVSVGIEQVAPGALTPTDSLTTKVDLATPKAGLSMAKGAGQTRKSVTNHSNSASKSNDWTVVNRTSSKKKSTGKSGHTAKDPVVVGVAKSDAQNIAAPTVELSAQTAGLKATGVNVEGYEFVLTSSNEDGIRKNAKGDGWTIVRSPTRQNTSSGVQEQQQHLSIHGPRQIVVQVTSPNVFDILAVEDDVGMNSPPINNTKMVQQYTSDGKKEIGNESRQLLLSTGNVYDVVKEFEKEKSNVQSSQHKQSQDHRELVDQGMLQGKLWADQVGGEEDEDGVDFEYGDDTESEGGSPLSVASPTAQGNKATRTSPTTKLSPIAPVFVALKQGGDFSPG
ncbi:hypothetical protein A4A49_33713 [Nicotiana attenuata]|uniref:Uncharacterized protein n=1 Tax=Nicotiana attenuata TaxID=49451 RepID=A0A314KJI5_NICAT|nr:hypothetical protein A4A49_33713 [Nicotiana attenuata]